MYNKATIGSLLISGYEILKEAEIESYQIDCQLLLGKVLDKDRIYLLTNRNDEVDDLLAEEYIKLVNLRKERMPLKYMLGCCEFMGRTFIVRQGVLIPRPDTEVLVETTVGHIKDMKYKQICDVCCGSGIIGITISLECRETNVLSLDISDCAIAVTEENIHLMDVGNSVAVVKSDLLDYPLSNGILLDAVISNPPYIRSGEINGLMEDVKNYEPYIALSGGDDGLDFYRKITVQALGVLKPNGMLAFEIGYDQKMDVSKIMIDNGFINVEAHKDLSGRDRVVIGFVPDNIS